MKVSWNNFKLSNNKRVIGFTLFWDIELQERVGRQWNTYYFFNVSFGPTGFGYENLSPYEFSKVISLGLIEFYWGLGWESI